MDQLAEFFAENEATLKPIRELGQFSKDRGSWWIAKDGGSHWSGEGPDGFSIQIDLAIISFNSLERFGSLLDEDCPYRAEIRRMFELAAGWLSSTNEIAVVAGGWGDSDAANDVARAGESFQDVCAALKNKLGPPAQTWDDLESGEFNWIYRRIES